MTTHDIEAPVGLSDDTRPVLDTATGTISAAGRSTRLTKTEQSLLMRFMQSPATVLGRDQLYDALYASRPDSDCPDAKVLDVLICKLRSKLARIGCADLIQTVWGRGFRLTAAPAKTLGLTSSEWVSLQIIVAAAERQNMAAAATIRSAMQRLNA